MIEYVLLIGFLLLGLKLCYDIIVPKITHALVIRNPKNINSYTKTIRCQEKYHKDGSKWWHSFPFSYIKTPAPPDSVVDTTIGGKKWVEGYEVEQGQFVWLKDQGINPEGEFLTESAQKVIASLEPFDVTERSVLLSEYEKSVAEKGKNFLTPEFILPFTAIMLLGIIIIGGLIFVPDAIKSMTGLQGANTRQAEINLETSKLLFNITGHDVQACLGQTTQQDTKTVTVQEGDIPILDKYI